MVRAENLTKIYGKHTALDNINFTIDHGKITGFLGPNGAGKSTTMNIITGYSCATEGKVFVDGDNILDNPEQVKQKIGYLPEQPPLYDEMTVEEYISFVAALKKISNKQQLTDKDKIYENLKLGHVRHRLIRNLSKGYRQRVGLAQALVGNPKLLILDEPTVGLDPQQILEMRSFIAQLKNEHTIILSSHILSEVQAVCDRILILNKGRVVANDTPTNLMQKFTNDSPIILRIRGSEQAVRLALQQITPDENIITRPCLEQDACEFAIQNTKNTDLRADIFFAMAKINTPILQLHTHEFNLEELFLQITNTQENK